MRDLVGRSFSLANRRYLVVDVQRLSGDALVYTRQLEPATDPADSVQARGPRTAFHYRDIAEALALAPPG